jgi:hypothetical protein
MTIKHLPNIEYLKPLNGQTNKYASSYGRTYIKLKNGTLKRNGTIKHSKGYYGTTFKNKTYSTHRLIVYAFYNFPFKKSKLVIHHKNEKKNNNHLNNLEITTNRRNHLYSKKGPYLPGIYKTTSGKFSAHIKYNYIDNHLGTYNTQQEAFQKYKEAESIIDKDLFDEIKTYYLDFTNTIPISKFNPKIDYHNKIPFFKDEYNISTINLKYYFQLSKKLISSSFKIPKNYFNSITQKNQILKLPNGWLNHPTPYPSLIYIRW